jgi:outer membrane biosynthesis protein TonB
MTLGRQFAIFALALLLLVGTGCLKKKPHLPAQAKAPADPIPFSLPGEISETVPPPPPPQPTPQPPPPEVTVAKPPKRHSGKKKTTPAPSTSPPATSPAPAETPGNNTVAMAHPPSNPPEPSPNVAIAADVSNAQLMHQKQSTAQLLDETEKSITGLKGLSHDQEEMVAQIRSYLNQSRKATTDGDFERAYNLATKAHLLSDALVKK